jgi:hypothetical protein
MSYTKYKKKSFKNTHQVSWASIRPEFIQHTTIMWINNNLKSLSERNFLVPFFTHTIGPAYANIFKVANDAALLFYRIAIKTIGTTDTALLAHVHARKDGYEVMPIAFKKLTTKVITICLPLLGIILLISLQTNHWFHNIFIFHAFIIMALCYIAEVLLLPYERILEIKQNYFLLCIAYVPYSIMLILLFTKQLALHFGLLGTVLLIHGVRLVSLLIMAVLARYHHMVIFPLHFFITRAGVYIGLAVLIHGGIQYSRPWLVSIHPLEQLKIYKNSPLIFARNEQTKKERVDYL